MNRLRGEEGLTLIELLVAAAMMVILVMVAGTMLISAVQTQPEISKRTRTISTARFVLERMTREIRNGIAVDSHSDSVLTFRAYVRHGSCGSTTALPATSSAILCQVTYDCSSGTACTRRETATTAPTGGTPVVIFKGINSTNVFSTTPETDPKFVGITLRFPNPGGKGNLTVSDGATLRGADLLVS